MYHASSIQAHSAADIAEKAPNEAVQKPRKPIEFSTENVPQPDRFDAWRASYSAAFDLTPDRPTSDFSARHRLWDLGSMAFQAIETDALGFASLASRSKRDPVDHWVISLLLKGDCTTTNDDIRLDRMLGVPQLVSLGAPFHGTLTHSKLLLLYVPRDVCRDSVHILDAASLSLLQNGMGSIFADYMKSFVRRLPDLEESDLPDLVEATRSMLVAAVAPSPDRLASADKMINAVLLERIKRIVQDNLSEEALGVDFILKRISVSRSCLYRIFEPLGGVVHYIKRRRLLAAHRALADPFDDRYIGQIAEEYCFSDPAEFSRAFKREFGYTPSDVRATGLTSPLHSNTGGEAATDLNSLLKRLQA